MCQQHGVAFVGPSAEALSLCGDKDQARLVAKKAGLPILPGAIVESKSAAKAAFGGIALRAGAVLKAISGGGGKGIRHVNDAAECDEAYERCASEASRSFADGRLLLERYVPRARHIEVQLLVDSTGQVAHLGDRDCSIQRRYQKIIEIAPAPLLHADLRAALHHDAVRFGEALVSSGMCGLATVEFLLDMDNHSYYFMECNPRLQVEATITEEISGVDLVSSQLRLIHGTSLSQLFSSHRSSPFPPSTHSPTAACSLHGSAVQARVSATSLARIGMYCEPRGAGVRVDSAAFAGMLPHPSFDPLLAKVFVCVCLCVCVYHHQPRGNRVRY
jgi:acetyl/propionyl-CoA carboxylase alpha subunit